jgi:hypothetical protein
LLYVDDTLIAAKSKKEITILKSQLSSKFEMKDLGAAKKILGMKITKDIKSSSGGARFYLLGIHFYFVSM